MLDKTDTVAGCEPFITSGLDCDQCCLVHSEGECKAANCEPSMRRDKCEVSFRRIPIPTKEEMIEKLQAFAETLTDTVSEQAFSSLIPQLADHLC